MFKPIRNAALTGVMLSALVLTACSGAAGAGSTSGDTITIGAPLSTTGPAGGAGVEVRDGAKLAIKQINDAGGIDGKKVALNLQDPAGDPAKTVQLATPMMRDQNTVAMLGPLLTPEISALYNLAAQNKVVMIPPASVGVITGAENGHYNDYTFRVNQPYTPLAKPVMAKAVEQTHAHKVAVLFVSDNPIYVGMGKAFGDGAKAAGAEVQLVPLPQATTDFTSIVSTIASGTDGIVLALTPELGGASAMAIRGAGIKADFIGDTSLLGADVWKGSHGASLGAFAYSPYLRDASPQSKAFAEAFQKEYNHEPGLFSALGYDAVKMVAAAASGAKEVTRESVQKGLSTLKDFPGVTGTLTYAGSGDVIRASIPFVQVGQGGAPEQIGSVEPEHTK